MLCARCHLDALLVVRRDLLLKSPCVEGCALVIRRGFFATSSFVEGRPLVPSFANVIGVLPLLQDSEFYHVRLMKTSPKLLFIVVIIIFSILSHRVAPATSSWNLSCMLNKTYTKI